MKTTVKTLGLLTAISAVSVAFAASPRVSIMTSKTQTASASARLPSIAGYVPVSNIVTGTTTTSTTSSLLTNAECIDTYTGCLKSADACGSDFEECTTNVLLHAKMPNCFSVLSQCTTSGINDLFGTSSVTALANVSSKNSYGEVTRYTYPTDGSVLGQLVIGAAISNTFTTDQCVKRYMSCLHKDNVCGEDFELCTTNTEFKKQAILCGSTLARCQGDGITELYGSTNTSAAPAGSSRLGVAISEGASLAALNAVSTCYKVADQCILNACGANPYKCMVDSGEALVKIADAINEGTTVAVNDLKNTTSLTTSSDVMRYVRSSCHDSIGGNKYCYSVVLGNGSMPSSKQLSDEDNKDEIFTAIYSDRAKSVLKQKITKLAENFDTKAKNKCVDTIKSCAMRSCGSGLGSVCYDQVFNSTNGEKTINGKATYQEIKTACEAIVNTDSNCQYAAAAINNNLYTYSYTDGSVFTTLFPEYDGTDNDPIAAVGVLNSSLQNSYSNAALAEMKKKCSNVATSCVKSLCGTDYVNCYRNRTDVLTNTYDTGSAAFDKSMNKVGGVLDYTIVTGLCINQVKSAEVCEEHLKIEAFKLKAGETSSTWSDSVRGDWLDAAKGIKAVNNPEEVVVGCKTSTQGDNCNPNAIEACDFVDEDGCLYDQQVTEQWDEYSVSQSANNLFQQILMDIEKEAQAKYNAKLTYEQNVCTGNDKGGVRGSKDNNSTFMWVKLNSNRVPKNYAMKGLTVNQFKETGDLYGAFCRARVTVMSDDKYIQDYLSGDSVAYFAVGDPFTCGSWISQKTLDKISRYVAEKAAKDAGKGSKADSWARTWWTTGASLLGGIGSFAAMDSIQQNNGTLGGLINPNTDSAKNVRDAAKACLTEVERARQAYSLALVEPEDQDFIEKYNRAVTIANRALSKAKTIKEEQDDDIVGLNLKTGSFQAATMKVKTETRTVNPMLFAVSTTTPDLWSTSSKDLFANSGLPSFSQFSAGTTSSTSSTGTTTCSWNDASTARDLAQSIQKAGANCGCTAKGNGQCYQKTTQALKLLATNEGVTSDSGTEVKTLLQDAIKACGENNSGDCKGKNNCEALSANVDKASILVTCVENQPVVNTRTAGTTTVNTTTTDTGTTNVVVTQKLVLDKNEYINEFSSNLDVIENYCLEHENVKQDNSRRRNINLAAGAVGALGSGILAYKIVQSAQEVKYEKAENEAVKEWMEEVGSHIHCYVGTEELGDFGDPVVFELDY